MKVKVGFITAWRRAVFIAVMFGILFVGLGASLGNVFFGFAMAAVGFSAAYDRQGLPQPVGVNHMISWMYIWGPMIVYLIAVILLIIFFDNEEETIDAEHDV